MALGLAQKHLDTATLDSPPSFTRERARHEGEGETLDHPSHAHVHMHVHSHDSSSHELFVSEMEEIDYEGLQTDRLSAHLLAGGAAGMMEHCCMYPVDCVKVCVNYREFSINIIIVSWFMCLMLVKLTRPLQLDLLLHWPISRLLLVGRSENRSKYN